MIHSITLVRANSVYFDQKYSEKFDIKIYQIPTSVTGLRDKVN